MTIIWLINSLGYLPVGLGENSGFLRDNTDDNISTKNSENTFHYWIWKKTT